MPHLHPKYDKLKLLAAVCTEIDFAERTIALVPPDAAATSGVCGFWSVKDVIAHLTSWEVRTLRWLADAEQGKRLVVPEEGFGWDQFDALNDVYYHQNRERALDDILEDFRRVQTEVLAKVAAYSDEELAGGGRMTGMFIDSPADAIAANTSEHYALHLAQIREWLSRRR